MCRHVKGKAAQWKKPRPYDDDGAEGFDSHRMLSSHCCDDHVGRARVGCRY